MNNFKSLLRYHFTLWIAIGFVIGWCVAICFTQSPLIIWPCSLGLAAFAGLVARYA